MINFSSAPAQRTEHGPVQLPWLKKLDVHGKCDLFHLLIAAPNLDRLMIQYDCLKLQLNEKRTCDLLQQRIIRLHILNWTDSNLDLLEQLAVIFTSLYELVIGIKESQVFANQIASKVLSLWKDKSLFSLYINGQLSDDAKENLYQWLIDNTHITANSSFAVQYIENWLDLWI